jgi:predicted outer membrane repeat protein
MRIQQTYPNTSTLLSTCNVEVSQSTLTNNSAISNGGAILSSSSDQSSIYIYNSTLVYNSAYLDGSGIYNGSSTGSTISVLSNGFVGFGTTTPEMRYHFSGYTLFSNQTTINSKLTVSGFTTLNTAIYK